MAAKFSLEKRELAELSQSYLLEIFIQSQENTEDETTAVFVLGIPGCSSFKVCVISALLLLVQSLAPARAACKELVELPGKRSDGNVADLLLPEMSCMQGCSERVWFWCRFVYRLMVGVIACSRSPLSPVLRLAEYCMVHDKTRLAARCSPLPPLSTYTPAFCLHLIFIRRMNNWLNTASERRVEGHQERGGSLTHTAADCMITEIGLLEIIQSMTKPNYWQVIPCQL